MPNTREKLIESLELLLHHNGTGREMRFTGGDVVPVLMSVQKWIPVTERLPDRDDMVIAFYPTMRGTSGEMQIHKAWAMSETCTHWMPLPQPPKGE